jgi:hypothetical protein
MQESDRYYKDGVARILELLKDTFGDQFKSYFNGQPEDIADAQLPCIMVSETTGAVESDATGVDLITETVVIILALNRKDDIGADESTDLTEFKLRKLVKGQYPDGHASQGHYLPETVMYAIRKNITMENSVLQSNITTDFDIIQRGEDTYTQEAYVTVTLQRLAAVPSRD